MATTRPLSRQESDNDSTQYSLDLGALPGAVDESMLHVADYEERLDQIHSEDIDGPSDFTQNMELWMRGKLPNVLKPQKATDTDLNEESRLHLEEYVSSDDSKELDTQDEELEDKENRPPENVAQGTRTPGPEKVHEGQNAGLNSRVRQHDKVLSFLSDLPDISASSDALGGVNPTPSPRPNRGLMMNSTGSPLPSRKAHPFQATVESFIESPRPDSRVTHTTDQTVVARPISRQHSSKLEESEMAESIRDLTSPLISNPDVSISAETANLRSSHAQEELRRAREEIEARVLAQRANDEEIAILRQEVAELRVQLTESQKASKRALQGARDMYDTTLRTQKTTSDRDLSKLQAENTELQRDMADLQTKLGRVRHEQQPSDGQSRKLQELQDENEKLLSRLDQKEDATRDLQANLADIVNHLKLQSQHHAELREQILSEQRQRQEDNQKLIADHQSTINEKEKAWRGDLSSLQEQLESMRKERDEARATTEEARRENTTSLERLQDISQKYSAAVQQIEFLKTENETKVANLTSQLETLRNSQLQNTADESNVELRLKLAQMEGEKAALERMLQDNQARFDQEASRTQHLERTIASLKDECAIIKDELRGAREEIDKKTNIIKELEASSNEIRTKLESTQQDFDKMSRQDQASRIEVEQLQGTIGGLETSLASLTSKLKKTESDLEDTRKQLDQAWQDADEARNAVKDAWELSGREKATRESNESVKLEEVQRLNSQLEARVRELLEKESDLIEDKLRLEAQLEADVGVDEKQEALEADLERLQDKMDAAEEDYKHQLSNAKQDQDTLRKKITALEKNLVDARKAREVNASEKNTSHEDTIAKLKSQCERLKAQKDAAENTQDDLQAFLKSEQEAHHDTNAKLSTMKRELRSLRQDYEEVHRIMDETIAKAVRKREQEWQAKFSLLLEERKLMGKALMIEWGEKEFGPMEPKQGYNYRFKNL